MDDSSLRVLELRLEELEVDDLTISGFIGAYNGASDEERRRFKAMGDRRLLAFVRRLPAARHARGEATAEELQAQAREVTLDRNVAGVLSWVDEDPARAALARDAERDAQRPRKSLLEVLDAMLERG
jgi:hypothetical protein